MTSAGAAAILPAPLLAGAGPLGRIERAQATLAA